MKQLFSAILFFIPFLAISQNDKLHSVFVENFADSTSNYFRYGSTGNKSGFKYKFGVNSLTEAGTNILSFRSEEHTSELQSRENLVCRLLLELAGVLLYLHSFPTRRSSDLFIFYSFSCYFPKRQAS